MRIQNLGLLVYCSSFINLSCSGLIYYFLLGVSEIIWIINSVQFSHSGVRLFVMPWSSARQASLSITNSQSLLKLMSIESVMPSNHLILCHPLLLSSVFPSIRVFSNESVLCIRWPKYWSLSFRIRPSDEYSGLISFRMDWLDLLAVQGTLKSIPTPHLKGINSSAIFFMVQLTSEQDYWKDVWLYGSLLAKWCLCFLIHCLGLSKFFFQEASVF